jgi:hypothetical protein
MHQENAQQRACRLFEGYVHRRDHLEGTDSHRQFLERDPNRRLGYRPGGGGFEDVKNHPWFRGIDWVQLFNKESTPPFEPDVGPMLITTEVC